MKTDCDIIRDLLPLYSDKVCSESSRRLVEEHCARCEECSEQLLAMSAELPREEKAGGAKNPLKKTKRHYLKLAVLTAALAVPLAVVICVFGAITVNENYRSRQISWSSISAECDMKNFGRMLKTGNYREALSMVGFKGLDGVNRKNEGELLDVYTKIFEDFFSEYPISYIECEAQYIAGYMKGELDLYLDEKYTADIPLKVYISFDRDEAGDCFITQAMVNCYDTSDKYEGREDECGEIYNKFMVPFYPGSLSVEMLEDALRGTDLNSPEVYTPKYRELDIARSKVYSENVDEDGFVDGTDDEVKKMDRSVYEYRVYYRAEVKRLFTDDYTLISVEGEEPYYSDEVYLDNSVYAYGKGCFKQRFTLNMETKEGESFFVKFTSRVQYIADIPEDIEFSDNTPEEFREGFCMLFC
ncbi:MAG: zf-HC2 domain-containing protein [Huintestinicola sp.]|uniref:zf-HC2 domain-containing protein n=1 Tax=Huintestinicola sp. TaxID=2981661 RepID=UPI003F0A5CDF